MNVVHKPKSEQETREWITDDDFRKSVGLEKVMKSDLGCLQGHTALHSFITAPPSLHVPSRREVTVITDMNH